MGCPPEFGSRRSLPIPILVRVSTRIAHRVHLARPPDKTGSHPKFENLGFEEGARIPYLDEGMVLGLTIGGSIRESRRDDRRSWIFFLQE